MRILRERDPFGGAQVGCIIVVMVAADVGRVAVGCFKYTHISKI